MLDFLICMLPVILLCMILEAVRARRVVRREQLWHEWRSAIREFNDLHQQAILPWHNEEITAKGTAVFFSSRELMLAVDKVVMSTCALAQAYSAIKDQRTIQRLFDHMWACPTHADKDPGLPYDMRTVDVYWKRLTTWVHAAEELYYSRNSKT